MGFLPFLDWCNAIEQKEGQRFYACELCDDAGEIDCEHCEADGFCDCFDCDEDGDGMPCSICDGRGVIECQCEYVKGHGHGYESFSELPYSMRRNMYLRQYVADLNKCLNNGLKLNFAPLVYFPNESVTVNFYSCAETRARRAKLSCSGRQTGSYLSHVPPAIYLF